MSSRSVQTQVCELENVWPVTRTLPAERRVMVARYTCSAKPLRAVVACSAHSALKLMTFA